MATPALPSGYQLDAPPLLPAGYQLDSAQAKPQGSGEANFDTPLDEAIPLSSYGNATMSGLQSVARGLRDAAKGTVNAVVHPIDTIEGMAKLPGQATQIPAAVHDINQSSDPTGTYAKVAQETAGQGAGQALVAAGTEGLGKVVPKAIAPVTKAAKAAAQVVKDAATPENIGTAVGGAAGYHLGDYAGGALGAGIGKALGKAAGKALASSEVPPVPEGYALDATAENPEYAGEKTPSTTASAPAEPVEAPAEPAAAIPEPAAEPAPKITPAKVEQQISESLGNKPLQPGVSLRNQGKVPAAAAPALPDGFTPVDSTALKGYKYDPEAREFESITQGGQHYVHGDVSPEEAAAFEAAKSKGQAWSQNIRQNNPLVAKVVNGQRVAVVKPRSVIVDPDTGAPEFSDVVEAKKPQAKVAAAGANEDLTSLLQKSLDQVRGKKPPQSVGDVANVVPKPGGVMTTADPGMLTDRWGTSAKSIADTDAQIRGKSPAESQAYIDQLADAYKKGRPVEPVMETRDADNNITSVDGRHRALAAKKAGIERIPILIRRLPAAQ